MKYAIIESGGKQYKAVEGQHIDVDKLPLEVGSEVKLDQVLFLSNGDDVSIGTPLVKGASVSATVAEQFKGRKILVFKYKSGTNYRRRKGHRQQYTRLMIDTIQAKSSKKSKKSKKEQEDGA
jgi:large subunit ribosomal protein L21